MDMRTGGFRCENCGGTHAVALPVAIDMLAAQAAVFQKNHRACKKTWTPPPPATPPAREVPMAKRVKWWMEEGERGISSNTMLDVITGRALVRDGYHCHPLCLDDFKRCWKLLQLVPELRDGFDKLAKKSPVWARLLAHWDELAEMMPLVLEEWRTIPSGQPMPTANKMYRRMKELINNTPSDPAQPTNEINTTK
jgi:hypothetical protein